MRYLSKKITDYIIKAGAIPEESYEVYQYGFQIGLEMFSCFIVCLIIALHLHMIPEFVVSNIIFILLRSYAGGIHLHSFLGCFFCSIAVQTIILFINAHYSFTTQIAWIIIGISTLLIFKAAPVENINRELELNERKHCKAITFKVLIGIIAFSMVCTYFDRINIVSLIALTIFIVFLSQYAGKIMYELEKKDGDSR